MSAARPAPMSAAAAVEALGQVLVDDPEAAHGRADDILLAASAPEVRAAYEAVMQRAPWWAAA